MDRSLQHAFDAEEIMAYLDGELEPRRAAALAAHLVGCGECQEVAKSIRAVSDRILNFDVEPAPANLSQGVIAALDAGKISPADLAVRGQVREPSNWWRLFAHPRVWAIAGAAGVVAILVIGLPTALLQRSASINGRNFDKIERLETGAAAVVAGIPAAQPQAANTAAPAPPPDGEGLQAPEAVGPMIVQTASLSIVATNYDEASAAIERLAAAHGGYVEKLDAKAQSGTGRELSAALRIPAKQLDGFLADVRKLGHVEEESRENEDVSAQYVDLQARLRSARATEQRLIELLGTRTGKLQDVLDAERELARIRGEIESMQGQNAILLHRVSYATVQVELSEVYRERLGTDSKGTRIRNAVVEGFGNAEDGAVSVLIFLLAYGPALLFWLAMLLVPSWLLWRRFRPRAQA
jgi:hypothetical protein